MPRVAAIWGPKNLQQSMIVKFSRTMMSYKACHLAILNSNPTTRRQLYPADCYSISPAVSGLHTATHRHGSYPVGIWRLASHGDNSYNLIRVLARLRSSDDPSQIHNKTKRMNSPSGCSGQRGVRGRYAVPPLAFRRPQGDFLTQMAVRRMRCWVSDDSGDP